MSGSQSTFFHRNKSVLHTIWLKLSRFARKMIRLLAVILSVRKQTKESDVSVWAFYLRFLLLYKMLLVTY